MSDVLAMAVKLHEECSERVRPFSSGSQFGDWESRNCLRCKKRWDEVTNTFHCDLDAMLTVARVDDGTMPPEHAKRIGFVSSSAAYTWDCPERELKDAS